MVFHQFISSWVWVGLRKFSFRFTIHSPLQNEATVDGEKCTRQSFPMVVSSIYGYESIIYRATHKNTRLYPSAIKYNINMSHFPLTQLWFITEILDALRRNFLLSPFHFILMTNENKWNWHQLFIQHKV